MSKWIRASSGVRLPRGLVDAVARAAPFIEDHACWGLPAYGPATKLRLHLVPLGDLGLYTERSLDPRAFPNHVPLARLHGEASFLAVCTEAPHAVAMWDHGDGALVPVWPSFEAFLGKLIDRTDRTPAQRLEATIERAAARSDAGRHAEALALLEPAERAVDPSAHEPAQIARLRNLIGLAYKGERRFADARAAFKRAGDMYAELNLLDLETDDDPDPRAVLRRGLALRSAPDLDAYGKVWLGRYLAQAYLDTGEPAKAEAELRRLVAEHAGSDQLPEIRKAFEAYAAADRPGSATARTFLAWFV